MHIVSSRHFGCHSCEKKDISGLQWWIVRATIDLPPSVRVTTTLKWVCASSTAVFTIRVSASLGTRRTSIQWLSTKHFDNPSMERVLFVLLDRKVCCVIVGFISNVKMISDWVNKALILGVLKNFSIVFFTIPIEHNNHFAAIVSFDTWHVLHKVQGILMHLLAIPL